MKLWLAPLHGITYYNFRNCFIKHFQGIDCAITPFIPALPKERLNSKKLHDLLPENNTTLPVIPQIMGNIPNDIKETVIVLHETFGYKQFNWNIGCPMHQIARKKRGCGVMPFPNLIEETVNAVCGYSPALFSLKMRLGMHTPKEGLEVLQRVAPYPIDFLCIHPRLGVQQYEGTVDLDNFETFYQSTYHKIVYSGDIYDVDFFMTLQQRFPKIEDWMLGRGILQNPFLAEDIVRTLCETPQERTQRQQIFMNFYHDYSKIILNLFGEKIALSTSKELWRYFAVFWKLSAGELQELLRAKDYEEFMGRVSAYYVLLPLILSEKSNIK
ncbi:MAG: tRNA-dihydrouridine synthase family protein [Lentimicrobiaceae bacterium]|nr:tRNA-dihydrouridine synthase family protein [Lentimicrobiaceae bacterium]